LLNVSLVASQVLVRQLASAVLVQLDAIKSSAQIARKRERGKAAIIIEGDFQGCDRASSSALRLVFRRTRWL